MSGGVCDMCAHLSTYPDTASLWEILLATENAKGVVLTTKAHPKSGCYEQPSVTYTNKEISTNSELRATTLRSLGIQDSCVLRLRHISTDVDLDLFMETDKMMAEQEIRQRAEQDKIHQAKKIDREEVCAVL